MQSFSVTANSSGPLLFSVDQWKRYQFFIPRNSDAYADISPLYHSKSRFSKKVMVSVRVSWNGKTGIFFIDPQKTAHWTSTGLPSRTSYHTVLCFSSSVIFLLVDACVGLNWLLVSFLSHVNKNIIHSIHSFKTTVDQNCYIDILKTSLLPKCRRLYPGIDFVFMQDSATSYHAKATQQFLRQNNPDFIAADQWMDIIFCRS